MIIMEYDMRVVADFIWDRIGTSGELSRTRYGAFDFHETHYEISELPE
jgi:hypothetical protein